MVKKVVYAKGALDKPKGERVISKQQVLQGQRSIDLNDTQRAEISEKLAKSGTEIVENAKHPLSGHAAEKQKQEKQQAISEIKDTYNTIRDAEKLLQKRTEIIMSNTAYIDYDMISKDQKDTNERIAHIKERIEEKYKKVNPELAALREDERNKVKEGMDPKQAQKERREAVKAFYNKKQSMESR